MGIGRYKWGANRFDTLVDNGDPANRVDVAILGDGYAAEDMPLFYEDVDEIIACFQGIEPTTSYWKHFNFHRVNVISQQSGIDDKYQTPPVKHKSALGTHFSFISPRRLVGWDWRTKQVARRAGVPFDHLLVTVNTPRRGGATRFWLDVGYASRNSADFPRIMIHEAGHAIAKLIDEYTGEIPDIKFLDGRSLPNVLPFANASLSWRRPPWEHWLSDAVERPTPRTDATTLGDVGVFKGAFYTKYGTYRPTIDCMMRRHSQEFCPVCREQWIKRIYKMTNIADSHTPDRDLEAAVGESLSFSAETLRTEHIHTKWAIRDQRGNWQVKQVTDSFAPFAYKFSHVGRWTVECVLEDHNPMLKKASIIQATRQKLRWVVVVR